MPTESEWYEIVEAAYSDISPYDDSDAIAVLNIKAIDDDSCIALVNPHGDAGWVHGIEPAKVNGEPITIREIESKTGFGGQRVRVTIGI